MAQVTPSPPKAWLSSVVFKPEAKTQTVNNSPMPPLNADVAVVAAWQLKGIYAEDGDSVAIIQTTASDRGLVVEVGEYITDDYTVREITPAQVSIADNSGQVVHVLQLASNHLETLAANTEGGEHLLSRMPHRPLNLPSQPNKNSAQSMQDMAQKTQSVFSSNALVQHLNFKPQIVDGQTGWQLSASSTQGFNQLRRLGLRQGDILLTIDGKVPSPEMWRVAAVKWRQSQTIRVQIKRHGKIETIALKQ